MTTYPMRTLIVPGLGDSGPAHWQTLWEKTNPGFRRVRQRHWDKPQLGAWSLRIKGEVQAEDGPVLLVAHSFGCLAAIRAVQRLGRRVVGALLVAPADPDKFGVADDLPSGPFEFPAMLVASRNDPWLSFEKARQLAERWGAELVDAGEVGHLNADAGFGPWPEGERLLADLTGRSKVFIGK